MCSAILRISIVLALLPAAGCTHRALRRNTINVAGGINQIHQQQVLDNLAMFAANPYALPHFALPGSGTSQVNDVAKLDTPLGLGRFGSALFGIATFNLSPSLSRAAQESWGLAPVNDPRQLELMRCAYQRAVSQCGPHVESYDCPDCEKLWNKFYTGDPDKKPKNQLPTVSADCLETGCCWFRVGCKKCANRRRKCGLVGEYCGTYVWIPESSRDQFTKLTLTILDIVFTKPATSAKLTKAVTYYLDENDNPVVWRDAKQQVTANIPIDRHNDVVLRSAYVAQLEALLKEHDLTTDDLRKFSIKGWSSQELGRLLRIADYLQFAIVVDAKSFEATTPKGIPDIQRDRAPSRFEVIPAPPAEPVTPAGDLLQLQRELDRVTMPLQ